ncbi:MAG TPA: hypothetical protein VGG29_12205 [Caulobacteraceae bacterium]|jgi:hypothetical protein
MRLKGFALAELLVAVAIAGLIVTVLAALNVDYVGLARRVADQHTPYALGERAEAMDPCAHPASMLRAGETSVDAEGLGIRRERAQVLGLTTRGGRSFVSGPGGVGETDRPVRMIVEGTAGAGGSMAAIEVGDATVGVVAPRCDLEEVCSYDPVNQLCSADEVNGTDGGNATVAGSRLAGPG